jgi:DNA invertase Pin-like site-specific DNA recombinase
VKEQTSAYLEKPRADCDTSDRLARSTRDLMNTFATIIPKKAAFKSLGGIWADTTTSHGRLMLTVLGGPAEFKSHVIPARTGEGRARAVARGLKMGRPPKRTLDQQKEQSSVATRVTKRLLTSPAATTSARRRFRGCRHRGGL